MNWWKDLKGKVRLRELLKEHTTLKIGGRALYFVEPRDIGDLKSLLNLLKRYKMPLLVLGDGSNILVSDKGINALILRLNSPYFKRISFNNNFIEIGSAVVLNQVIRATQRRGLSGAEFLAGIPGTLGGALIMNAGAHKKCIGNLVKNVTVMDYNGSIKTFNIKNIKFRYRKSNLSKYIILSASLSLIKKDKQEIKNKIDRYLDYRRRGLDSSYPSAGCIFKNPPGYSAGQLIDLCGLKGRRIGDACISQRHANFILNLKSAKACDVLKLMDLVKKKVKEKFNITLEPEIKIWQ